MEPIKHNGYILEWEGPGLYTVYSGPDAKQRVSRCFTCKDVALEWMHSLA